MVRRPMVPEAQVGYAWDHAQPGGPAAPWLGPQLKAHNWSTFFGGKIIFPNGTKPTFTVLRLGDGLARHGQVQLGLGEELAHRVPLGMLRWPPAVHQWLCWKSARQRL